MDTPLYTATEQDIWLVVYAIPQFWNDEKTPRSYGFATSAHSTKVDAEKCLRKVNSFEGTRCATIHGPLRQRFPQKIKGQ